jgi:2-hydroxychromene-2-carboxylate isomerase
MMLDYYFTLMSPFSYLGHEAFLALAKKYGASVRFRPVRVMALFAGTGGLPLGQRAPARQQYRLLELQRWRDARGLPLNLRPKHFPTNPEQADRAVIAIAAGGGDPAPYMLAMYCALWVEDRDIADTATIAQALHAAGHDADAVLHDAASDAIAQALDANTAEAIRLNLPGVPGYIRDDEAFWGQDRLELLERALANGRRAFTPAMT